jgi:hypothetical protein
MRLFCITSNAAVMDCKKNPWAAKVYFEKYYTCDISFGLRAKCVGKTAMRDLNSCRMRQADA